MPIRLPPLRERREDIPLLAEHFLTMFADRHRKPHRRLSPPVLARFESHVWRGNVRELQHIIEMLVLFGDSPEVGLDELPKALGEASAPTAPGAPSDVTMAGGFGAAVEAFERRLLSDAIGASGGVKAEAARRLGLDPNQMKYLCRKYGL